MEEGLRGGESEDPSSRVGLLCQELVKAERPGYRGAIGGLGVCSPVSPLSAFPTAPSPPLHLHPRPCHCHHLCHPHPHPHPMVSTIPSTSPRPHDRPHHQSHWLLSSSSPSSLIVIMIINLSPAVEWILSHSFIQPIRSNISSIYEGAKCWGGNATGKRQGVKQ